MPKFYQGSKGNYYTKLKTNNHISTLQIHYAGARWLIKSGFALGDELGAAFRDLQERGWLSTRGEFEGGSIVAPTPGYIPNEALTPFAIKSSVDPEEPLTVRPHETVAGAPLFLHSPSSGVYYTILSIENSSDYYLEVPLLIKHLGAMELIEMGAEVGAELPEAGLRAIFEHRWGYFDDERLPE